MASFCKATLTALAAGLTLACAAFALAGWLLRLEELWLLLRRERAH